MQPATICRNLAPARFFSCITLIPQSASTTEAEGVKDARKNTGQPVKDSGKTPLAFWPGLRPALTKVKGPAEPKNLNP